MPEMDGLTYLKTYFHPTHPKVMIVSSTSRDDASTAINALKLGATDFVEKPSLLNLQASLDEIRTKLRAMYSSPVQTTELASIDTDYSRKINIVRPESKMRLMFASVADIPKAIHFFKECQTVQPPSIILFEGCGDIIEALVLENQNAFKQKLVYLADGSTIVEANTVYFADAKKIMSNLHNTYHLRPTSILCYGITSSWAATQITTWKADQVLIEDYGNEENQKNPLMKKAHDIVPATSYAYMSNRFFSVK
jgi:chemotaxis response regulator CheB